MKKKNMGFEITIMFLIILLGLIFLGFYYIYKIYNEKRTYTLIFYPYYKIECTNNECNYINKVNDNNEYETYIDGEYKGSNKFTYTNDNLYIFDDDYNNIYKNSDGKVLGVINGDMIKTNSIYYKEEDISDNDISLINNELNKNIKEYNYGKKVSIDINNDNKEEVIYTIINDDILSDNNYSILVIYINGKYKLLSESNEYSITLNNIIDINMDSNYELSIKNTYDDMIGYCIELYRLKNNKFIKMNECEITN